jgi:transposase
MEYYVGLDVSLKQTSICVVDQTGAVVREGVVDSDPEAISVYVRSKAPDAIRIGLETGPTSTWLWTELKRLGLPVICIDARHAKAVLKMQINKSDRNDAIGIARIMQTGWFKEVHVKDIDSHSVRALLASRALPVKVKRDLENHVRGLLKNLGLIIGRAKFNVFAVRAEELIEGRPELIAAIRPLLEARNAVGQQVSELDRKVMKLARHDAQVRRFMTVPGVGPITALAFKATIDDPTRFARSRSVGAYIGLTSRRHASGEVDWTGRISKCGDDMLRSYLFEAAGVLLTRVPKWSAVKAWGGKARQAQRTPQGQGCGRAQACGHSASHVDRRNRVQLVEAGDCCLASRILRSCQTAGKDVPAGTMAMVSSTDFLRASERTTAIATLNRQRHLTPSCGGSTPTAERTVGPARTIVGELDTQTRN